ncbi:hypothetical protein Tco_1369718 [Tanacetum coccineum]
MLIIAVGITVAVVTMAVSEHFLHTKPTVRDSFRNVDCGTGSRSDNTVGSPHGFVIHGIEVLKVNENVTEVIDVENWRVDNSRVLRWIVSLFEWNSSVSSTKSSIQKPGGSRSRIYKVFEVEPMKEKEVHNSSKDARLSEAATTIIGSNRGLYYSLKLSTVGGYITTAIGKQDHYYYYACCVRFLERKNISRKGVKRSRRVQEFFLLLLHREEYMSTADMLCDYILILLMYLVNAAMFTLVLLRIAVNTASTARFKSRYYYFVRVFVLLVLKQFVLLALWSKVNTAIEAVSTASCA